ncbi:MAG: OmpA family protein [Candidatus Thorarchaeota archaeon]
MRESAIIEVAMTGRKPVHLSTGKSYRLCHGPSGVVLLELEDICFNTDRSIFLPGFDGNTKHAPKPDRLAGLDVVRAVLEYVEKRDDKSILIAGHTDTMGSANHNLRLSEERARNFHAYLIGDRDGWAANSQRSFEIDDVQAILKWVSRNFGWDCDPGRIDNKFGGNTRDARNNFRTFYNEEFGGDLEIGVKQCEPDWKAIFDVYEETLSILLGVSRADLPRFRRRLSFMEPAALGCGEYWPREAVGIDGHESASNRRVEILFFDLDETLNPNGGQPPGKEIYGSRRFRAEYLSARSSSDEFPLAFISDLHLSLRSHTGIIPLAGYRYRLFVNESVLEGVTDDTGAIFHPGVPPGNYRLNIDFEGRKLEVTASSVTPGLGPCLIPVKDATI